MASGEDLVKTAVGLLVKKDRAEAKRLNIDEIVREIDYIKFQLNALARSQLFSSITFFKEGVLSLFKLFNKGKRSERALLAGGKRNIQTDICARSLTDPINTLSRGLKDFKMETLGDDELRVLSSAKDDFKQARIKATEAFSNEALSTSHRIQAIAIRAAAKILENVDHPEEALAACRLCLEDLHSLKEVQESFGTELHKRISFRFNREERRQIISSVCRINRAIYDVASIVGKSGELLTFPLIDNGRELVDPLHDPRVSKILAELEAEHYSVKPLSLGEMDESENKLKIPQGIVANSKGHFIVGDEWDRDVKVFDCNGKYKNSLLPISGDSSDYNEIASIVDVAIDSNDKVYVLVERQKSGSACYEVYVFDEQADCWPTYCRYFSLRREAGETEGEILRLTVNNKSEILALADRPDLTKAGVVEVYSTFGYFKRPFGEEHLKCAQDISAASDGRIIVLDRDDDYVLSVHVFQSDGEQSFQFEVNGPLMPKVRSSIACYHVLNHVVIAVPCRDKHLVKLLIYAVQDDKEEFVRSIEINTGGIVSTRGITVTVQGHIAVGLLDKSEGESRVVFV